MRWEVDGPTIACQKCFKVLKYSVSALQFVFAFCCLFFVGFFFFFFFFFFVGISIFCFCNYILGFLFAGEKAFAIRFSMANNLT